jgi:photosystem II stability/assembly factor-like uncharacterized protein/tetratricopeptide (TPR) repeat protein
LRRSARVAWWLAVALTLGFVCSPIAAFGRDHHQPPPGDPAKEDAELVDITFADAAHGWAVGDRGVIWHTSDSGAHWALQHSGVDCRLTSVCFLDTKIGWVAGGFTQPYTHATTGVVLATRDGGEHWTLDRRTFLPAIRRIQFFDLAHGWALGQASAYFPSGVYATQDGGRSWLPLPASETRTWLAGDLIDPDTGALAGRLSALATVRRRGIELLPADYGLRGLACMKLVAPAGGWLVGEGGLILKTQDLGKSWQTTEGEIPAAIRKGFDFSALAVRGEHCWVAGTPGSAVLHSGDAGRTWQVHPTSQSLPIHGLAFIDDRAGWAVGDLGTILKTADGGRSWRPARLFRTRSAYAGFYSRAEDVPLELIARLSADEGYLGAIEILNRQDVTGRAAGAGDLAWQAHEASVRAGASATGAAWRFPLRESGLKLSAEQVVEDWSQVNDGPALEKLEAYVVARLRMWRPSVVFTASADARAADPLAHIINQVVLRAVDRAGDATQFADQISEAGLTAWKVQKVYGTLPPGQTGNANVNTAQLAARLGRSIGELAAPARGVIASGLAPPAANVGFRLLIDHVPQGGGQRDFFSGIGIAPGGEARRLFGELGESNLDAMRREAQLRRNLQAILARADAGDAQDGRFLATIGQQTRDMQPDRAAEVLYQLADRYYHQGRWEQAAECFGLIAERYPQNPLAASSLMWLVQYYGSGEAARRGRAPQGAVRLATAIESGGGVERAGGPAAARDAQASDDPSAKAAAYAKQLEQIQPALFGEPTVRFSLAAAHRREGLPRQAERFYLALRHSRPHDAWWACAQTELWLAERKGQPPKQLWNCARAARKPRLDGKFDDPLWHAGNVVELHSPDRDDADWQSVAMLAYDDEFLYVGVSCARAPRFKYVKSDQPRPRDAELGDEDRVELLIDIDRDFATYYRLSIDHRGWTADSCWQDKTWNPTWFVATGGDESTWTAQAAIPLAELTTQPPAARSSWAVGIQRVVPGVGFQSWTTPASPDVVPEGFGILMFQ